MNSNSNAKCLIFFSSIFVNLHETVFFLADSFYFIIIYLFFRFFPLYNFFPLLFEPLLFTKVIWILLIDLSLDSFRSQLRHHNAKKKGSCKKPLDYLLELLCCITSCCRSCFSPTLVYLAVHFDDIPANIISRVES